MQGPQVASTVFCAHFLRETCLGHRRLRLIFNTHISLGRNFWTFKS
jgi:hypothetical protein